MSIFRDRDLIPPAPVAKRPTPPTPQGQTLADRLLMLQAAAGNRATTRVVSGSGAPLSVQRKFMPKRVTEKAHLHTEKGGKARSGVLGWTGPKLKPDDEIVVDPAQSGGGQWIAAVATPPARWVPGTAKQGYVRGSKVSDLPLGTVDRTEYPMGTYDVHFDEAVGRFAVLGDLPSGGVLVHLLNDHGDFTTFYRADTALAAFTRIGQSAQLTGEHLALMGRLQKVADLAGNIELLVDIASMPRRYFRRNGLIVTPVDNLTPQDKIAIGEGVQKKEWEQNLAKDPSLTNDLDLKVENRPYKAKTKPQVMLTVKRPESVAKDGPQMTGLRDGLAKIADKDIPLPDGLEIYVAATSLAAEQANHFGPGKIVFTPQMINVPEIIAAEGIEGGRSASGIVGVAHHVEAGQRKEGVKNPGLVGCGVAVHEFGHVAHKQHNPGRFFAILKGEQAEGLKSATSTLAKRVSDYAVKGEVEFVAEVFTGLVHDKVYDPAVLSLYKSLGGYPVTAKDVDWGTVGDHWTDGAIVI